ncbi:hypothetical protein [Dysgonomonas sp. 25]|uniref:hypothetical protein n=1 Tax=Dysgonomonas sp. 25 TaxID=2302933 RepID=UPI0013D4678B|nr:hypothetical protein [Dysgonomonas sp. 25]NDV69294.1 hypothetical protein [Dysgonomonas sp. 25]
MKTDLYTKIILTVIAVFLAANFFKNNDIVTPAHAQAPVPAPTQQIQSGVVDVNLVQVNGIDIYRSAVDLQTGEKKAYIPISLEYVDKNTSTFNVNVAEYGGERITSDYYISVWNAN